MQPRLIAEDLEKGFETGSGEKLEVLRGISMAINAGEVVAITGGSGTGKTTLLHLLGALDRPNHGRVFYDGVDIFKQNDESLSRWRNKSVGFVFQFHHLLPEFSSLENVAMPALIGGQSLRQAQLRATKLLEQLGLGSRLSHRPSELSGGEQQRVAVARALMNQPALVLADEPSGSLDTKTAGLLHEELLNLSRTQHQAFVIATHNPSLSQLCDRAMVLQNGQLFQE
ncbi:MAG: ABC transporter ATP-binding protein [Bacteroidetes bacterium]|nr:ABC transporter ATP-binding protein [Bacteroidota bacterium]MCY4205977.1 ABC transporter ATP-binding protein [Bacteroidota bacterium]